jgi:hypothetical protein
MTAFASAVPIFAFWKSKASGRAAGFDRLGVRALGLRRPPLRAGLRFARRDSLGMAGRPRSRLKSGARLK